MAGAFPISNSAFQTMGIKSNSTILYGHLETYEERIDHLIQLRDLQDETDGFLAFMVMHVFW